MTRLDRFIIVGLIMTATTANGQLPRPPRAIKDARRDRERLWRDQVQDRLSVDQLRERINGARIDSRVEISNLGEKLEQLDRRLTRLERSLRADSDRSTVLNLWDADERLRLAERRLNRPQEGQEGVAEAATDVNALRKALERARRERLLAQSLADEREKTLELDLLDARYDLDIMQDRAQRSERLVAKGFLPPQTVKLQKLSAERARKEFELARSKLAAFRSQISEGRPDPVPDAKNDPGKLPPGT